MIYRKLKVGSGNAVYSNDAFCVPKARYLGVMPDDIRTYDLPTHKMSEVDIKRIDDAPGNHPFIRYHNTWQMALNELKEAGHRAEQQAFAVHDLNHVMNTYLPAKLADTDQFLP